MIVTVLSAQPSAVKVTLIYFEANAEIPDHVFRKPKKLSELEGDR